MAIYEFNQEKPQVATMKSTIMVTEYKIISKGIKAQRREKISRAFTAQ